MDRNDEKLLAAAAMIREEERAILRDFPARLREAERVAHLAYARKNAEAARNLAEAWAKSPAPPVGHVAPELVALKRHLDAEFERAMQGEGVSEPRGILSDPDIQPDPEAVDRALAMIQEATAEAARADDAEYFALWAITQGFGSAERAREAGFRVEPCSCCLPECAGWKVTR